MRAQYRSPPISSSGKAFQMTEIVLRAVLTVFFSISALWWIHSANSDLERDHRMAGRYMTDIRGPLIAATLKRVYALLLSGPARFLVLLLMLAGPLMLGRHILRYFQIKSSLPTSLSDKRV